MIRTVSQRPHRNHNLRLPSMTIRFQVRQLLPAFFLAGTCVGAVDSSNLAILQKQAKPNVVFVLADDMGYGDLACYGNPIVHSPNIDLLARQGIRFTQAYAPSPVCSPSRAGLLTGRTPVRLGVTDAIGDAGRKWNNGRRLSPPANPKSLALDEITLAEAFHKAGYATASIGNITGRWPARGRCSSPRAGRNWSCFNVVACPWRAPTRRRLPLSLAWAAGSVRTARRCLPTRWRTASSSSDTRWGTAPGRVGSLGSRRRTAATATARWCPCALLA